eukprot:Hpha_TRINITY_DN15533_c0_g1::TRINITY_DN15533_c0_g1_i1::g.105195::m.105195
MLPTLSPSSSTYTVAQVPPIPPMPCWVWATEGWDKVYDETGGGVSSTGRVTLGGIEVTFPTPAPGHVAVSPGGPAAGGGCPAAGAAGGGAAGAGMGGSGGVCVGICARDIGGVVEWVH